MSHTPGPWKVHPRNSYVVVSWGNEIASIADGHGNDEAVANGELIAAAPDLLHACKTLLKYATRTLMTFVEDGSTLDECLNVARAAIAKAEGKA